MINLGDFGVVKAELVPKKEGGVVGLLNSLQLSTLVGLLDQAFHLLFIVLAGLIVTNVAGLLQQPRQVLIRALLFLQQLVSLGLEILDLGE